MGNDSRQFFTEYLSGKLTELQAVTDQIQYLNWNRHDRYLVLRLETQQQDDRMHSSIATLGHIEAQIPEGLAFTYLPMLSVHLRSSCAKGFLKWE